MSSTPSIESAVEAFRAKVNESYELEADFVDSLCQYFKECAPTACPAGAAPKAEKRVTKPRRKAAAAAETTATVAVAVEATACVAAVPEAAAPTEVKKKRKSGYNDYVREMMKHEDIASLNHKEKMVAIGGRWKAMSEEARAEYSSKASSE
jgi:hypothetical protein